MSKGPLAVRWGARPGDRAARRRRRDACRSSWRTPARSPWRAGVILAYHWLDDRDNPIVWDGERTAAPGLEPGERGAVEATVRAPIPPGPYRLAFDMVAENRAWFSELGSPMLVQDVLGRRAPRRADGRPARRRRARARLAGARACRARRRLRRRRRCDRRGRGGAAPHVLAGYAPGPGRVPGFAAPLLCPSVLPGIELDRLDDVAGLPAFAAPRSEPWVYDGRIVLRVRR